MPRRRKDLENDSTASVQDHGGSTEEAGREGSGVDGLAGVPHGMPEGTGSYQEGQSTVSGSRDGKSLTAKLTDNGGFDLGSMRQGTIERLRQAVAATPELLPDYGELKLDGAAVPDFMVNAVYQLIGGIEQWVFARKYGPEIASIMAYRPQDIAMLSEPTKAVLAKYLPKLGKYQEETALVMALASIHIGKVQAMNSMLEAQQRRPDVTTIHPVTETPQ